MFDEVYWPQGAQADVVQTTFVIVYDLARNIFSFHDYPFLLP